MTAGPARHAAKSPESYDMEMVQQRATPLANSHPVQVGVQGVRQFAPSEVVADDCASGCIQERTIQTNEFFPSFLDASSARGSQCQIGPAQRKYGLLGRFSAGTN